MGPQAVFLGKERVNVWMQRGEIIDLVFHVGVDGFIRFVAKEDGSAVEGDEVGEAQINGPERLAGGEVSGVEVKYLVYVAEKEGV